MIFDTHVHSEFSFDSNFKVEDVINSIPQGNNGMILTEHVDWDYSLKDEERVNFHNYFKTYKKYRSDNFLLGVEIGLPFNYSKENTHLIDSYDFDFVLGAIHSIKNIDIFDQCSKDNFNIDKEEMISDYLKEMIKSLKYFNNFDSLAHIDYICRYLKYDDNEIYLYNYKDFFDIIFKFLINNNKALELNTRRLASPKAYASLFDIYKYYKELGGTYITLGSDSHSKKDLFSNFNIAQKLAKDLDLKIVYFKNRKMIY